MKNYLFRILTLSVIASLLFSGCTAVTAIKSSSSRSTSAVSNNSKTTSLTITSNSSAKNNNVVSSVSNDWIYYVNSKFSDPKKGTICKLYRAHSDGSEAAQVTNVETDSFIVSGDWIYYNDWERTGIYKIHGDGTGKTKLNSISDVREGFCKLEGVYDKHLYLYYVSESDPPVGDAGGYIY